MARTYSSPVNAKMVQPHLIVACHIPENSTTYYVSEYCEHPLPPGTSKDTDDEEEVLFRHDEYIVTPIQETGCHLHSSYEYSSS